TQSDRSHTPAIDDQRHGNHGSDPARQQPLALGDGHVAPGEIHARDDLARAQRAPRKTGIGACAIADLEALQYFAVAQCRARAVLHPGPAAARIDHPYDGSEETADVDQEMTRCPQQLFPIVGADYGGVDRAVHADDMDETLDLLPLPAHLRLRAQDFEAESQVGRELLEERQLRAVEGVGSARVDVESTDARVIEEERQSDGRAIAFTMRLL